MFFYQEIFGYLSITATACFAQEAVPSFQDVLQTPLHPWQVACSLLETAIEKFSFSQMINSPHQSQL